jgi:membrane protein YdbS with pleckstrin-like domain
MTEPPTPVKVVTLIVLGVVLVVAVIGLTVVAVFTDRDVWPAERLTFGGVILLCLVGGLSIYVDRVRVRRRRRDDEQD